MEFSQLSLNAFCESDCYNSFTALEVNQNDFLSEFGEQQFLEFHERLLNAGFLLAAPTIYGTLIYSFPTPLRDSLRDEIEQILDNKIFS